jgi:hypothetical protein
MTLFMQLKYYEVHHHQQRVHIVYATNLNVVELINIGEEVGVDFLYVDDSFLHHQLQKLFRGATNLQTTINATSHIHTLKSQ